MSVSSCIITISYIKKETLGVPYRSKEIRYVIIRESLGEQLLELSFAYCNRHV